MKKVLKISDIKIRRNIKKESTIYTESLKAQGRLRGTTNGKMNYQNN